MGTQVINLSFGSAGSSEYSYWSDGGVYELLGMSSDCEPRYETEIGGEGCETGVGFSWVLGVMALGEMYGDCKAETNADDGGETRGELYGDDSIELFKFGERKCEGMGVKVVASPGLQQEVEVLIVRPHGVC